MKIIIGQESKSAMVNFEDLYEFLTDLCAADDNGKCKIFPHLLPFNISRCADHSAHQKATGKGGACKVKDLFCFACTCTSKECFIPNTIRCSRYCSNKLDGWNCYHKEFSGIEESEKFKELITNLESIVGEIIPPVNTNTLHYKPDPSDDDFKNERSIYFNNFRGNTDKQTQFLTKLTINLRQRNLATAGTMSQKRQRLLNVLMMEHELKLYRQKLEHCTNEEGAFYCAEDAVPCILHLENRVGIIFLQLLFLEGHSNCESGEIFTEVGRSTNAR